MFFTSLPIGLRVALVYAASRLWGWFIFSTVGLHHTFSPWKNTSMGYLEFVTIWDADWYAKIAAGGYPEVLPVDANGHVAQNEWAFYPLYPLISGAMASVTGLSYQTVAPTVSLLFGFGAAWFIYRLFEASLQMSGAAAGGATAHQGTELETTALWATAAVSFCAVAPILQTGYAEATGLFFLAWALYWLVQQRYVLLLLPALGAALSRPVGVPLGAVVGIWWFVCWVQQARTENPLSALKATAPQLASALTVCAFAFIHPAIAWASTGRIDAYTATEAAWRAGGEHVLPFVPWYTQSQLYLGQVLGPLVLILLLGAYLLALLAPVTRRVLHHPALITWCAAYTVYMLAFFNPQSSTFRLLLPLFPLLLPLVALSASRAYRWLLILSGATLQFGWVGWLWHWKQLPGGGDYPP
ncbi:hypothetical protein E4U03_10725 [Rothia nasimurium]|uniref:Glycosyltransferase RgtA/B/C/D-like domain-containing protein n=1 Tax=Rothia nasimurium TaxID=85336 RepID=A0A4Y9F296_9MICC|nr:hypothetical protein [Rothia nasimurium]TFU20732.1 hypothetical protein E4U03_10725 [Rothia nasimurium]